MEKNKGLFCIAIGVPELSDALKLVGQERDNADVIEIRLDSLVEKTVQPFIEACDVPLLFTNRPNWEGGAFQGDESERISLLEQAVDFGADYVDCELRAPDSSLKRLQEKLAGARTKLILSWHDFEGTPSDEVLIKAIGSMKQQGADIGKIVTTAHDYLDVLRVLNLQKTAHQIGLPLIAFCMGEPGIISRLATLELGGYMTYCAPQVHHGTATGQISGSEMRNILSRLLK